MHLPEKMLTGKIEFSVHEKKKGDPQVDTVRTAFHKCWVITGLRVKEKATTCSPKRNP